MHMISHMVWQNRLSNRNKANIVSFSKTNIEIVPASSNGVFYVCAVRMYNGYVWKMIPVSKSDKKSYEKEIYINIYWMGVIIKNCSSSTTFSSLKNQSRNDLSEWKKSN